VGARSRPKIQVGEVYELWTVIAPAIPNLRGAVLSAVSWSMTFVEVTRVVVACAGTSSALMVARIREPIRPGRI